MQPDAKCLWTPSTSQPYNDVSETSQSCNKDDPSYEPLSTGAIGLCHNKVRI
jgi:hypothetical protein